MKPNTAEKIDTILNGMLKHIQVPIYAAIFNNWSTVVGEKVAEISSPYKVITSGNKKVLILKVKKGKSTELQHESQKIIRKIDKFLGTKIFSQVKIIQIDINEEI